MSETSRRSTENRILSSLPAADYERLAPHLQPIEFSRSERLYLVEERIEYVYFPVGSMISLVSQMADGASIEVGVVGFEGMAGLPFLLGVERSPHETMAQIPGAAMRVSAEVLRAEFERGGALQKRLLRYTQSLLLMTSQLAACNRLHHVDERMARWLLMSYERCNCDELPLTQEFLAMMLGVRRSGVTETAVVLQTDGYINYRRGHISILDRKGLEDVACDCYDILKREFERVAA
ncbi:MAG TPA: Crp/Fnr family transcriptional regulator [Pyrinomonadaceae bacterium]|jgi:CRP-like cAMP-binding protein